MRFHHSTDSKVTEQWLQDEAAARYGGRVQPVVNEVLNAMAEGRLVDPSALNEQIRALQGQVELLERLLIKAMGGQPPPVTPPAPPASGGLQFTK